MTTATNIEKTTLESFVNEKIGSITMFAAVISVGQKKIVGFKTADSYLSDPLKMPLRYYIRLADHLKIDVYTLIGIVLG